MPKKIKNCFYQKLTFGKLLEAHKRSRAHKAYKNEVIKFEINLENNIINLLNNIKNKKYHLGKYYNFKVYEPKERLIKALPYVDRIVHQWYIEEFIKPYIVPKFINTTFACLVDKGTHKAVESVQNQMREFKRNYGDFWVLKCDIRKFFYSINPYILFDIMKKYISDKALLDFTRLLIFDGRKPDDKIGIPIGNYTSQFFANIYLNELDQYVKRTLKIHYFTRYMDDFILLLPTKKDCIEIKQKLEIFLHDRLLRLSSKKKIKKNVKKWNKLYAENSLDIRFAMQSINSWLGHTSHCNSFKLQNKVLNDCNFLYNEKFFAKIETNLINLIETDQNSQEQKRILTTLALIRTF